MTDAIPLYERIRDVDPNFKRDTIIGRLVGLYTSLGRDLVESDPPAPESARIESEKKS